MTLNSTPKDLGRVRDAASVPQKMRFRLRSTIPAAGAMRALERVADKALQLGEASLCNYRSHSSSQCKNASLLHYAVSACIIFLLDDLSHDGYILHDQLALSERLRSSTCPRKNWRCSHGKECQGLGVSGSCKPASSPHVICP